MRWWAVAMLAVLSIWGIALSLLMVNSGARDGAAQATTLLKQMTEVLAVIHEVRDEVKQLKGSTRTQMIPGPSPQTSRKPIEAAPVNVPPVRAPASSTPDLGVRNRHLVIDVGFNEGGDAHHLLSHGYDVIGVEANPKLIEKAKGSALFQPFLEAGQLQLVHAGVAGSGVSELSFWEHPKKSYWGQLGRPHPGCKDYSKDPPRMECIERKVPLMTCQEIIDKYGVPLYIKIDIEKQDADCLLSLAPREDPCRLPFYVSFERSAKFKEVMAHIGHLGYKYFKQVLQREWDRKHRVTSMGQASGPFGEWAMDELSISKTGEKGGHLWKYANTSAENLFGKNERPPGNWVDIHARLDGPPVVCKPRR